MYTEPVDVSGNLLPMDGLDVFPAVESGSEPTQQVDALAYGSDAYLDRLFDGEADLLFSIVGDGEGREWALLREDFDGDFTVEWFHADFVAMDPAGSLDDVDAAELWGDLGTTDVGYCSLKADVTSGISVYVDNGGTPLPFITYGQILSAVQQLGYVGEPDEVDVDGIMVYNAGTLGRFEPGDVLLFSVRATPNGNFDGGEIVELRPDETPVFLEHGGHLWDTAFDLVAGLNPLNGGVDLQDGADVDALEASFALHLVGTGETPRTQALARLEISPNPFNPSTQILFELTKPDHTTLVAYDSRGRYVATLVDEWRSAGEHLVRWNGTADDGGRLSSGVYYLQLRASDGRTSQKAILVK